MNTTMLGGGSPLNKFKEIDVHLSRASATVHVELDGSDSNGDGSVARPFSTFERALSAHVGTTDILTIELGDGDHELPSKSLVVSRGKVDVTGTGRLVAHEGSHAHVSVDNGFLYIRCAGVVMNGEVPFIWDIGPKSTVFQRCPVVCDNKQSIARFVYSGGAFILRSAVTYNGSESIPLVSSFSGAHGDVQIVDATLTNVTE